jgi:hypothetical protein
MTNIDTSTEALDALLSELHFQGSLREDAAAPDADASKVFAQAWSMLKALAAERDALKRLNAEYEDHITAVEAERDRLAAEVAKMRADMQWFLDRVERGEVRSTQTAARFRATLAGDTP